MKQKTVSELFNEFLTLKSHITELMLRDADFTAQFKSIDGTKQRRRPVVLVNEQQERKKWRERIKSFESKARILSELDPDRFPATSTLFNPMPVIVDNVTHCQIYHNDAVSSRLVNGLTLAKRTKHTLKGYKSKHADLDPIIEKLSLELAFWLKHSDEAFRIRCVGYSDIQCLISYENRGPEKVRVTDMGLLLFPDKNWEGAVNVKMPEQRPQKRNGIPSKSIYHELIGVDFSLPIDGKIYFEKDVIEARDKKIAEIYGTDLIDIKLMKKSKRDFLL